MADRGDLEHGDAADRGRRSRTRGRNAWRAEAQARIDELRGRLAVAMSADADPSPARMREEVAATVLRELERAAAATRCDDGIPAWWTGSAVTDAWEAVHNAELALLRIEDGEAIRMTLPRLLAWISRTMASGERREAHEAALHAAE